MARYSDTIRDQHGAPIQGAKIYVYVRSDETLADLEEDGGGSLANPITSDQYGGFYFNAADGLYDLVFHYGGKQFFRDNRVMVGTGPELPEDVLAALSTGGATSFIGWLFNAAGAVLRTLQSKLLGLFPIDAADFGVVADASATGTGGTDNKNALAAAIAAAAGRPLQLPAGNIRTTGPLVYQTTGNQPGFNLRGAGESVTTIWCDFDGPRSIFLEGTSAAATYRFQFGGAIRDLSLKAVMGREIGAALEMVGCWRFNLKNFVVDGGEDDNDPEAGHGFSYGILTPERDVTWGNPDGYAVVYVDLTHVEIRNCSADGVRNRMALGASNWTFRHCRIEANWGSGVDNLGGEAWTFEETSLSYNGWHPSSPSGWGAKIYGTSSISVASIRDGCEFDSNHSGGVYFSYVLAVECARNRFLSSRREPGNIADRMPIHIQVDTANPIYIGKFEGNFHRVDLSKNDQITAGFSSAVTYYHMGTGLTANLRGVDVWGWSSSESIAFQGITTNASNQLTSAQGTGGTDPGFAVGQTVTHANIPSGTTITAVAGSGPYTLTLSANATASSGSAVTMTLSVPVTYATSSLTAAENLNRFGQFGRSQVADRTNFYAAGLLTQDWTTAELPLIGNLNPTGWDGADYYDPLTGIYTMPFTGRLQFSCSASINSTNVADQFLFKAHKSTGGAYSVVFDQQELASIGARTTVRFGPASIAVNKGDRVKFTIQSGLATRTAYIGTYIEVSAK